MSAVRLHDTAAGRSMFFTYDHLKFRYEPFPIGLARPIIEDSAYADFIENYPPQELFAYLPKVGRKYSLSEKFNARQYQDLVRSRPVWREFHRWIKSDEFIVGVMDALEANHIELGYSKPAPRSKRVLKAVRNVARGRGVSRLNARFEFSMLPADGGHILPHTDLPSKIVTLVVSMVRDGDWDPTHGGGTDVNKPRDMSRSFNRLNRQARFEDMEVVDVYEFTPNQAVIFVKTFNSWHSVRPMTGVGSSAMRRTLTINIEQRS